MDIHMADQMISRYGLENTLNKNPELCRLFNQIINSSDDNYWPSIGQILCYLKSSFIIKHKLVLAGPTDITTLKSALLSAKSGCLIWCRSFIFSPESFQNLSTYNDLTMQQYYKQQIEIKTILHCSHEVFSKICELAKYQNRHSSKSIRMTKLYNFSKMILLLGDHFDKKKP